MPDLNEVHYGKVQGVPVQMLEDVWPTVWPLLSKVFAKLDTDKYYSQYDIYQYLQDRDMQLWVAIVDSEVKAAFVTQFVVYPRRKVLDILLVGGEDAKDWVSDAWETFKEFAKSHQAQGIRGFGRRGWAKILDSGIKPQVIWDYDL